MSQRERAGYQGTGPGAITPDGCAVELYARLPVDDEPDIIERAVPAGGRILELGCGVGRVTHPLLERGFVVTAVDESPQMLERVHGARTICSPIESLRLDECFDAVLLASYLVHAADPQVRHGLLQTCRRQVADDGCVLIQRDGVDVPENLPLERELGDGLVRLVSCEPAGGDLRSIHVEYIFPDARWTQTYLSCCLTQDAFDSALADAGLVVDQYLTADRTWVRALPVLPDRT